MNALLPALRSIALLTLLALCVVGCQDDPLAALDESAPLVAETAAAAKAATVTKVPYIVSGVIPCTGELVAFDGEVKFVSHIRMDGSGGLHVTLQEHIHANGSGDHGNAYRINENENLSLNVRADGLPFTANHIVSQNVIGKGKAANYKAHINQHLTVNNNGDVTANVNDIVFTCK